jgi:hypothetical protein
VIYDAKTFPTSIQDWQVGHLKRMVNVVAHTLAKYGRMGSEDQCCWREVPECIQHIVASDSLSL